MTTIYSLLMACYKLQLDTLRYGEKTVWIVMNILIVLYS
jgi:hypothetical protein